MFNGAIKDTLEKTEALQKHVKDRHREGGAESLANEEAVFFKTLLDRQEEAQRHMNELCAAGAAKHHDLLPTKNVAQYRKREGTRDKHARPLDHS